jgi:hypothetical protein
MSNPGQADVPAQPAQAPIPTDPAQLEREIADRQARLAATVGELTYRLSPKEVTRRARTRAQERARAAVFAEDGTLRVERVAAMAVAISALLGLFVWRRLK